MLFWNPTLGAELTRHLGYSSNDKIGAMDLPQNSPALISLPPSWQA